MSHTNVSTAQDQASNKILFVELVCRHFVDMFVIWSQCFQRWTTRGGVTVNCFFSFRLSTTDILYRSSIYIYLFFLLRMPTVSFSLRHSKSKELKISVIPKNVLIFLKIFRMLSLYFVFIFVCVILIFLIVPNQNLACKNAHSLCHEIKSYLDDDSNLVSPKFDYKVPTMERFIAWTNDLIQ